jgi:uncharacterized protein involved in exopolysaccharide biosynthesis
MIAEIWFIKDEVDVRWWIIVGGLILGFAIAVGLVIFWRPASHKQK